MLKEKKSVSNTPFHVLDGFKPLHGSSYLEAGYIFAPYVPLQVTPVINFEPIRIGFQNSKIREWPKKRDRKDQISLQSEDNKPR